MYGRTGMGVTTKVEAVNYGKTKQRKGGRDEAGIAGGGRGGGGRTNEKRRKKIGVGGEGRSKREERGSGEGVY